MKLTYKAISPGKLFVSTWVFVHIAAFLGPKEAVYSRYKVINETFTMSGSLWVGASLLAFGAGIWLANQKLLLISHPYQSDQYQNENMDSLNTWALSAAVKPISSFAISIVLLLAYWTLLAIAEVGSFSSFIETMYQNWHKVRNLWPNQKPFTGARLLYTGLISIVIFAASGLGVIKSQPHSNLRAYGLKKSHIWLGILSLGLIPLMLLPLLVSQRILLATAIVGGVSTYTVVNDQGIPLKYPVIGGFLGMVVWTSQEVIRVGFSTETIIESIRYGLSRLLLYFTNDIGNLHRGIKYASDYSYGAESFSFVLRYLFISEEIKRGYLQSFYLNLSKYKGGGGFTGLGSPYLDFGIFGLILVLIWGYTAQVLYLRSKYSILSAQIYGLVAASIVLSWHLALLANPLFWLNIAILIFMMAWVPSIEIWLLQYLDLVENNDID